jgi:tRNA G18 (ribose-2'-O)-methylase SpoU
MDWNCLDWFKGVPNDARQAIHAHMTSDVSVLCFNVQGDANLGTMMRTACLMGCRTLYLAGRKKWDKRYSVGAHHYIDVEHVPDLFHVRIDTHHELDCHCGQCKTVDVPAFISFLQAHGFTPCFIEQGGQSILDPVWKKTVERPLFIYGNEHHGIATETIRAVRQAIPSTLVLSIPQQGMMRSHNVSTACTIVLWEYIREKMISSFDIL